MTKSYTNSQNTKSYASTNKAKLCGCDKNKSSQAVHNTKACDKPSKSRGR